MDDRRKQGFRMVEGIDEIEWGEKIEQIESSETSLEEMNQKIRRHRRKIAVRIAAAVIFAAVLTAAAGIYFRFKQYQNYETLTEIERSDSSGTKYESFYKNILRYNNDGAFYADLSDNSIWNQAYEMQNPKADICGSYAAVADIQGNQIYIMNTSGVQGSITTSRPIEGICIAEQGTAAVLTQADGISYLELYNKSGENLASGEIHIENSGYPLDIALSNDANKLAVAILDISKGRAGTTIAFYNFGSVGQNEIDNIVSTYFYEDTIVPEINFVSNDRMLAFGDNRVIFFEGRQKPEEINQLSLESEVKSMFYNKNYFGLVYGKGDSENRHRMEIYDIQGKLCLEHEFRMSYQNIEFLENNEICIRNEYECKIYTLHGVEKFSYKFDDVLYKIFSGSSGRRYTFILDGVMEKVKLK